MSGLFYLLLIVIVEKSKGPSLLRTIFAIATVAVIIAASAVAILASAVAPILSFEIASIISIQLWLVFSSFDTTKEPTAVF